LTTLWLPVSVPGCAVTSLLANMAQTVKRFWASATKVVVAS
jgi:hypothetical protein